MIDLGHETGGNNEICLGVRFALCIIWSSTTCSYWALFLGRWSPFLFILYKLWYERFFSVESNGEGPRSKFEREDGQTDG